MSTMKQAIFGLIGLAFVALPVSSVLAADKGNGEKLATEKGCVGCHAADGNSTQPTNPILAGQYEDYLVQAMYQYKSGARQRQNAIMSGFAAGLTDKDIKDLAAWFSSNDSKLQYVK